MIPSLDFFSLIVFVRLCRLVVYNKIFIACTIMMEGQDIDSAMWIGLSKDTHET